MFALWGEEPAWSPHGAHKESWAGLGRSEHRLVSVALMVAPAHLHVYCWFVKVESCSLE